tara:strand:+ start:126 stop:239 length:114 start_codon:yes stop_codon:yes gene_type:complete
MKIKLKKANEQKNKQHRFPTADCTPDEVPQQIYHVCQ